MTRAEALLLQFVYTATTEHLDSSIEATRWCPTSGDRDGLSVEGCVHCSGNQKWEDHLSWDWTDHDPNCPWVAAAIYLDEMGISPPVPAPRT